MGYLVKASPNADVWAYASVEDIRTDAVEGSLTASAMVSEEQEDIWHPIVELIGEEPKVKQTAQILDVNARLRRPRCVMILGALYAAVGVPVAVLNLIVGAPTGGMSHITFIGLSIIGLGTFYQGWRQSAQLRGKTPQNRT